ncbi:ATP-binding protein, partial [Faecalibaculum rodentium]
AMQSVDKPGGIFLYGQPGTGKTYLLTALANDFARQGLKVSFVKVPLFVQDFRQSLEDSEYRQDMLGHLKFSDVVVLDDLGSEGISKWTRDDILFPVLDYRMQNGKKTYFSSNYTPEELLEKYQPDGDRVASLRLQERIRSLAQPVKMTGRSRRNSAA